MSLCLDCITEILYYLDIPDVLNFTETNKINYNELFNYNIVYYRLYHNYLSYVGIKENYNNNINYRERLKRYVYNMMNLSNSEIAHGPECDNNWEVKRKRLLDYYDKVECKLIEKIWWLQIVIRKRIKSGTNYIYCRMKIEEDAEVNNLSFYMLDEKGVYPTKCDKLFCNINCNGHQYINNIVARKRFFTNEQTEYKGKGYFNYLIDVLQLCEDTKMIFKIENVYNCCSGYTVSDIIVLDNPV